MCSVETEPVTLIRDVVMVTTLRFWDSESIRWTRALTSRRIPLVSARCHLLRCCLRLSSSGLHCVLRAGKVQPALKCKDSGVGKKTNSFSSHNFGNVLLLAVAV